MLFEGDGEKDGLLGGAERVGILISVNLRGAGGSSGLLIGGKVVVVPDGVAIAPGRLGDGVEGVPAMGFLMPLAGGILGICKMIG